MFALKNWYYFAGDPPRKFIKKKKRTLKLNHEVIITSHLAVVIVLWTSKERIRMKNQMERFFLQ